MSSFTYLAILLFIFYIHFFLIKTNGPKRNKNTPGRQLARLHFKRLCSRILPVGCLFTQRTMKSIMQPPCWQEKKKKSLAGSRWVSLKYDGNDDHNLLMARLLAAALIIPSEVVRDNLSWARQDAEDTIAVVCLNYVSFVARLLDVGGIMTWWGSQIPVGYRAEVTLPAGERFINGFRGSWLAQALVSCFLIAFWQHFRTRKAAGTRGSRWQVFCVLL